MERCYKHGTIKNTSKSRADWSCGRPYLYGVSQSGVQHGEDGQVGAQVRHDTTAEALYIYHVNIFIFLVRID